MNTLWDWQKVFFFAFGCIVTFLSTTWLWQVVAPLFWQQVWGKITHSEMTIETEHDSETGELQTTYQAHFEYTYRINERYYHSTRIAPYFIAAGPNLKECQIYIRRYPVGANVNVFVNPKNYREAVLKPITLKPLLFALFCLAAGVFYLSILIFNWPLSTPKPEEPSNSSFMFNIMD